MGKLVKILLHWRKITKKSVLKRLRARVKRKAMVVSSEPFPDPAACRYCCLYAASWALKLDYSIFQRTCNHLLQRATGLEMFSHDPLCVFQKHVFEEFHAQK